MKPWITGLAAASLAALPLAQGLAQSGTLTVGLGAEATIMDPTRSSAGVDSYFFGQMFGDMALTVVFSQVASLIAALCLIPMLASRRVGGDVSASWGDLWSLALMAEPLKKTMKMS